MKLLYTGLVITLLCAYSTVCNAQYLLQKTVSVNADQQPLKKVLDNIAQQGGFFFSYNSNAINADSIISIQVKEKTVQQTLDIIFNRRFEYKQVKNHIIIKTNAGPVWYVSGYVVDENTGEKVRDASVFEPNQLVASLTNSEGYFQLKLKDNTFPSQLTVSKSWYKDTSVKIKTGVDQEIKVSISPKVFVMDSVVISDGENVEGTWLGKFFLSSKQRMQSLNLSKFFVNMPVQASLTPGISSHGRMSSQVVNKASINLLGGYTAGVDGIEVGAGFNIVKHDARYLQVAGIFNIVGGDVVGFQGAGIYNNVLGGAMGMQAAGIGNVCKERIYGIQAGGIFSVCGDKVQGGQFAGIANVTIDSIKGIQAAGITNLCIKDIVGFQMAGITNTGKSLKGMQAAGIINVAASDVTGMQFSGLINMCGGTLRGMQAGSIINFSKELRGVQLGIINVADTANGVGIGLFSFVRKGYHKISISTNEVANFNAAIKTGTKWLYNIYSFGMNFSNNNKVYMYGFGWGSELRILKNVSINPEATGHAVYLGNWNDVNILGKFHTNINYRVNKYISVFAGPAFTIFYNNQQTKYPGFKTNFPSEGYKVNNLQYNESTWIGWNAGVTIF